MDHPDVADCCVVGVPDDYSGEVPLAFVSLSESALVRVKRDPSEGPKIKAALIKVCFWPDLAEHSYLTGIGRCLIARCGLEGGVQTVGRRRRVYRRDSEESEREAAQTSPARSGQNNAGGGRHDESEALRRARPCGCAAVRPPRGATGGVPKTSSAIGRGVSYT